MDPYGTFGAQQGIQPKQAIPVPATGVAPARAPSGMVDQWQYENPNPGVSRFTPVNQAAPRASITRQPGTATAPVDMTKLDSYYGPNRPFPVGGSAPVAPGSTGGQVTVGSTDPGDTSSWRNRLYAEREATAGRSSSVSAGVGPAGRPTEPYEAMKAPELPEYKGVGEYAPPEEDKGVYQEARREAMGPGMRELREGTREAISSAQSLDNPNARAKFIQQSLKGYGQGLEKVAAGAAKEGRTEARSKRAEQLNLYKTNYDIKSNTYLQNYQNQINTIAANFASEQAAQVTNYNASLDPSINVAGQTGGARDKSTYYGNSGVQQPFMGYMN